MRKTVEDVVKNNLCTGCGTCSSICKNLAIEMKIDRCKGIYLPLINKELCEQCEMCLNVCPGHTVNFNELNHMFFGHQPTDKVLGNYLNCHLAYATDDEIRYNSSSGGLITALLIFALEEGIIDGALVTGMSEVNPLEPRPFIATTPEQILAASKSKYCPVPANIAIKEILKSNNNNRFAVVGLPCHIQGIRKAEAINKELRKKIVLHMGIICEGGTFSFLGTEYRLKTMGTPKRDVRKIDYRGKGWPGDTTIQLKNGEELSIPYPTFAGGDFELFIPERCTLCSDATAELADVSFGDPWLIEASKNDPLGSSVIISRNTQVEDILQQMILKDKIVASVISSDLVKKRGFSYKKKNLKAHFVIAKLFGRKVPNYYQFQASPPLSVYMSSLRSYFEQMVALKRSRWWIMENFYFPLRWCFNIFKVVLAFLKQMDKKLMLPFQFIRLRLDYSRDKYFLFGDNLNKNLRRGRIIRPYLQSCGRNFTVALGATIGDPQNTRIGDNVYIGLWTYIGVGPITLEDDVMIGPHCSITAHNHYYSKAAPIIIGAHSWLGAGVSVTAGVKIGKFNVIGAGAVVTKDTDDYSVMAGVPAKKIGVIDPSTSKIIHFKTGGKAFR
jgi:coenzyme F420 hydrogenase subunit beta